MQKFTHLQKCLEIDFFWKKVAKDPMVLWGSKISILHHFQDKYIFYRNSRWPPKIWENDFWKNCQFNLEIKNFIEIVVSLTISEINVFLCFTLMMLQRFGMICLMMYVQPLLSTHSERGSKPISLNKHIHPNFSFSWFLSVAPTLAMSQAHDYSLPFWFGAPRVCL